MADDFRIGGGFLEGGDQHLSGAHGSRVSSVVRLVGRRRGDMMAALYGQPPGAAKGMRRAWVGIGVGVRQACGRLPSILIRARPGYAWTAPRSGFRSEEHTSELQSRPHLVCR